ncbi:MAG TPA: NAD(P)H-dependent glycerol-3-phosphate dehydrogenase [Opitutaceae bacterium]|nr:NAD(P)H-dependent glycerol-3-phosphate dehydrogenase [Opitutaceae bacterium]
MKFCVVGAGAWGTAFALHLARGGRAVALVPRRPEQAKAIDAVRENREYLPGIPLPAGVAVCAGLAEGLPGADVILLACPAQTMRQTAANVRAALRADAAPRLIVSLAKGLELGSHMRPSQAVAEALPGAVVGALSGPTNAAEFARGLPAAMVLAATAEASVAAEVQAAISGPTLRVYTTDDLPGVEFGACLKNIYAIAAGCCDGLGLGDNAKAALITRAVAEMVRVGVALGARRETFYGLSGFGDLVATCHGLWSRNREFGQKIGEGRHIPELLAGRRTVVEGYETTRSLAGLCAERRIDAPILVEVNAILFQGRRPADAISSLMMRELKRESIPVLTPA